MGGSGSGENLVSTTTTPSSGIRHRHFPPLSPQNSCGSSSATVSTDNPDVPTRTSSMPFVFPLPPTLNSGPMKQRKPRQPHNYRSQPEETGRGEVVDFSDGLGLQSDRKQTRTFSAASLETRVSWSDWIGTRGLDTRDLQLNMIEAASPVNFTPRSLPRSFPPQCTTEDDQSARTDSSLPRMGLRLKYDSGLEPEPAGRALLQHRMAMDNARVFGPRKSNPDMLERDRLRSYSLTALHPSSFQRLAQLDAPRGSPFAPHRNSSDRHPPRRSLSLTRYASSPLVNCGSFADLYLPRGNVKNCSPSASKHRNTYSLNSSMDSRSDQTMDSIQESPTQPHASVFPPFGGTSGTVSATSERKSIEKMRSFNFSYPWAYTPDDRLKDPKRRRSVSGGSRYHFEMGSDGQSDPRESSTSFGRSKSVNSGSYTAATLRKQHGGISPNIDVEELEPVRTSHARPPITSRTSPQYSRAGFQTPSLRSAEVDIPGPLTRRASYSSVTGISPVRDGRRSNSPYESSTFPRARTRPNNLRIDTQLNLDGSDQGSPGSLPDSPTSGTFPQLHYHHPLAVVHSERRRVDDFDFATTFDVATRPYTPDQFAVDAGMVNRSSTTTRNPSKRSARSFGSIGGRSFGSLGAKLSTCTTRSSTTGRTVLSKSHRKLNRQRSWEDTDDNMFSSELASHPTTESNGENIFSNLRSRSRKNRKSNYDELEIGMPYTATTSAGPARGIVREGSPAVLSVSSLPLQKSLKPSSFNKLGSLAIEGRGKYHTLTTDVKKKFASRRGSRKRSSTSDDTPDTKNSEILQIPRLKIVSSSTSSERTTIRKSYSASPPTLLTTAYHDGQEVLRQVWNKGFGNALDEWNGRRALERTYKYGPAGKMIPMYMSGGRPDNIPNTGSFGKRRLKLGSRGKAGLKWAKRKASFDSSQGRKSKLDTVIGSGDDVLPAPENLPVVLNDGVSDQQKFVQNVHEGIVEFLEVSNQTIGDKKSIEDFFQIGDQGAQSAQSEKAGISKAPTMQSYKQLSPVAEVSPTKTPQETPQSLENDVEKKQTNSNFIAWASEYWSAAKLVISTRFAKSTGAF